MVGIDIKLSEAKGDEDDDDDDDKEEEDMEVDNQQPSSSRKRPASSGDEAVDAPRKKPKTQSSAKSPKKTPPAKSPSKLSPSKPSPSKPSPSKPSPSKPSPSKAKAPVTASPAKVGEKPVCKYGVKCYQKSKKHKEQFAHPQVTSPSLCLSVCVSLSPSFSHLVLDEFSMLCICFCSKICTRMTAALQLFLQFQM